MHISRTARGRVRENVAFFVMTIILEGGYIMVRINSYLIWLFLSLPSVLSSLLETPQPKVPPSASKLII